MRLGAQSFSWKEKSKIWEDKNKKPLPPLNVESYEKKSFFQNIKNDLEIDEDEINER